MNKKGFTLIELLAVIVILAIIALIATPIILGIINDAREKAKVRSSELVYKGVEYAYTTAMYKLESATGDISLKDIYDNFKVENTTLQTNPEVTTSSTEFTVETSEGVICEIIKGDTEYIVKCGTEEDDDLYLSDEVIIETQVNFKPQYYISTQNMSVSGSAPLDPSPYPPANKEFYYGYNVSNGNIQSVYVCFVRDIQYCLKANDTEAFEKNAKIIKSAFSDIADDTDYCSFTDTESKCFVEGISSGAYGPSSGLNVTSNVNGNVDVAKYTSGCYVVNSSLASCY